MQKGRLLSFSLFICLLAVPFSFFASRSVQADGPLNPDKRFYYQIRLPETSLGCQETAVELAQRFSALAGVSVVDRACKGVVEIAEGGETLRLFSVGLTYLAKEEVFPYSAFFGGDFLGVPAQATGVFATYADCLPELAKQVRIFETATGYKLLAATCQEGSYPYEKSYVLRVDGFSPDPKVKSPRAKLYAFTAKFRSQDESLNREVEQLLARLGGTVALRSKDTVYYYGKDILPIRYEYVGNFRVAEECDAQIGEVQSVFSKLGSKTVIARCLRDQDPKFANQASLEIVRDKSWEDPSYTTDSTRYYSYSECMGDRARAMDEAISRGYTPLGAICRTQLKDRYEMQLFRRFLLAL